MVVLGIESISGPGGSFDQKLSYGLMVCLEHDLFSHLKVDWFLFVSV